jgi:K+-transporting ATPase KdpF subunit
VTARPWSLSSESARLEETSMLIVSAVIAAILLGYLIYALVRPEKLG